MEVTSKTIKILYASTNATYNLTQSCDTHYLNENLNKDKVYILQLTESSLHIKDKENNKDIALILTKEISYLQEKQILLDSQNFQTLQNVLNLHRQKDNTEVYVEVKKLRLSGKEWVKEYKDRASIEDLSSPFKENVKDFLKSLDEAKNETPQAKITYHVSSTRRPYERAVLMHYCHKVANNKITPQQAQQATEKENIPINWIHTDSNGNYSEEISREKALEMVEAYGMAYPASLTSHHVRGNAIDMTITWQSSFTIKDKIGKVHTIDTHSNGAENETLRVVGETYGVKRTLEKDPPHWSLEGN